jgi:gas vesicle protein
MKTKKALLGVLAGIAAGAVLGLLFAPNKGSEIRRKISKESDDLADAVNDKINAKFGEMIASTTGKRRPERQSDYRVYKDSVGD